MPLAKPYKRIWRPLSGAPVFQFTGTEDDNNLIDNSVAADRRELVRAYNILESDVISLFEYIEPHDKNSQTFSHRIYALLLRACTEFENNCKAILQTNSYSTTGNLNITDYCKIDTATKWQEYEVYLDIWQPSTKVIQPFSEWASGHSLYWYTSYNKVKHNRSSNFEEARLENLIGALAGVYVALVSQFSSHVIYENQMGAFGFSSDSLDERMMWSDKNLFRFKVPDWPDHERYDFDWNKIKSNPNRFEDFPF